MTQRRLATLAALLGANALSACDMTVVVEEINQFGRKKAVEAPEADSLVSAPVNDPTSPHTEAETQAIITQCLSSIKGYVGGAAYYTDAAAQNDGSESLPSEFTLLFNVKSDAPWGKTRVQINYAPETGYETVLRSVTSSGAVESVSDAYRDHNRPETRTFEGLRAISPEFSKTTVDRASGLKPYKIFQNAHGCAVLDGRVEWPKGHQDLGNY